MKRTKTVTRWGLLLLVGGALLVPVIAQATEAKPPQRAWMRANGEDPGRWMSRSGDPDETLTNRHVTDWAAQAPPGVDCQSGCHYDGIEALRQPVSSSGFTNAFGETPAYEGNQYPFALLTHPENDTAHAAAFAEKGCGACHSAAAAEERGLRDIVGCKSCHNFDPFATMADPTTGNLHATHVPFVQAEQALADPADQGTSSCNYCHSETAEGGNASCWNCHLSGHWPKVSYWKALPTTPAPAL